MPMLPQLVLFASLLSQAAMPAIAPPAVATDIEPPPGSKAVYRVEGRGNQVYLCAQQPDGMKWVLKGPAAVLYDASNQPVGRHSDGPQWTWNDGSAVRGTVIGRQAAPDPANVPWLLLKAEPVSGTKAGALDGIGFVKRSETMRGVAPVTGCDAGKAGASRSVPYAATYTFYRVR